MRMFRTMVNLTKIEFQASNSREFEKYGVVNSVDITSTSRTMHLLYPF